MGFPFTGSFDHRCQNLRERFPCGFGKLSEDAALAQRKINGLAECEMLFPSVRKSHRFCRQGFAQSRSRVDDNMWFMRSRQLKLVWTMLLVASLVLIGIAQSRAEGFALRTSSLVDACSKKEQSWISFCDGYIQAAIDLIEFNGVEVCIPSGTTRNQIFETVYPSLAKKMPNQKDIGLISLMNTISSVYKC
jgi:hypothetical protein